MKPEAELKVSGGPGGAIQEKYLFRIPCAAARRAHPVRIGGGGGGGRPPPPPNPHDMAGAGPQAPGSPQESPKRPEEIPREEVDADGCQ
jgi:hypothetical protein